MSVLIATYNRAAMLEECLASIMEQTVPAHQVIVIDDGSSDDTAGCVGRFGGRVQYLRQDNAGKARALNRAMPAVSGDFVWVFDDDDVALPTSIEDRLAALHARPEADVVFSRHYWGTSAADGRIERRDEQKFPSISESQVPLTLMRSCFTTLGGALVRTGVYASVGAFREELLRSQDYDMLIRLARRRAILLDRPTYMVRRHAGQRGPASATHPADRREHIWAHYDAMLGRALRREAALGEFLTPPVPLLTTEGRRHALLNRMLVMASKGLGDEMLDDALSFARESEQAGYVQLSRDERLVAIDAAQERYFFLAVVIASTPFAIRARELAGGPVGRALLRAYARGLLGLAHWGAKGPERARATRLALDLLWASCRFTTDKRVSSGGGSRGSVR